MHVRRFLTRLVRPRRPAGVFLALLGSGLVLLGFARPVTIAAAERPYHVVARWTIGGEGGWDYLEADPAARRLYVTHGTQVEVLDLDSGKKLGAIPGVAGAHGVAVAPEFNRGFIASGRDSALVVFDPKTLAVTGRIAVPARFPDAILYEPTTKRVITFNGGSDNACAFDAATGAFIDSLPLGGTPEFAVLAGDGRVFVNIESTSELVRFDAKTLKIEQRTPLAPGEEPSGLAIDRAHHLLFSGCRNQKVVITDGATGKPVGTLRIGTGVDACGFDAKRGTVFASCGDGTLTAAHVGARGEVSAAETDSTQRGARTMALDEKTGRVFVVTAQFGPAPAPTADRPHPRPPVLPGTFTVLVLDR